MYIISETCPKIKCMLYNTQNNSELPEKYKIELEIAGFNLEITKIDLEIAYKYD